MHYKLLFSSTSALACLSACLLLSATASANAQSNFSGRLFTTSIERQRIDMAKTRERVQALYTEPAKYTPIVDQVVIDGYVTRSSGKTTTWINDVALDEISRGKTVLISQRPGQAPAVSIQADSGRHVNVGVGDMLDIHTGVVRKIYESPPEQPSKARQEKAK